MRGSGDDEVEEDDDDEEEEEEMKRERPRVSILSCIWFFFFMFSYTPCSLPSFFVQGAASMIPPTTPSAPVLVFIQVLFVYLFFSSSLLVSLPYLYKTSLEKASNKEG